mgnify:FL=1
MTKVAKADLHVHSRFSEQSGVWLLEQIKMAESYVEPEYIYSLAKKRGMTFVTVTDHNRIEGSLFLKQKYPNDVFTGAEVTAPFPEDGCDVHVLVYGLTQAEFDQIQVLRQDIYDLRDYLKERNLAHAVAHATFAVNGKLAPVHLEKLILLFDYFESINGGRNRFNNEPWTDILRALTPSFLEALYARHRIEPFGPEPWVKGLVGGSDDHAGLFAAQTFTLAEGATVDDFLSRLKNKQTTPAGRHNDHRSLAFTLYKLVYDFGRKNGEVPSKSLLWRVSEAIFEQKPMNLKEKFVLKRLQVVSKKKRDQIKVALFDMLEQLNRQKTMAVEAKLDLVYDNISAISDMFLASFVRALEKDIRKGDIASLVKGSFACLSGLYLCSPFLMTSHHLFSSRQLVERLAADFGLNRHIEGKKILWFTDTINDMNGVSMTLRKIGWLAHQKGLDLRLVTSLAPNENQLALPAGTIVLPSIYDFVVPHYEDLRLKVPSVLQALKQIEHLEPEEVYVSTPGPVGLMGLLFARLFSARCVGVYHTDFPAQIREILNAEPVVELCEQYTRWFYSAMDEVLVPTQEYIDILAQRGLARSKMRVFKRGVDSQLFSPAAVLTHRLEKEFNLPEGFNLLYAGRISRDKNLDFLARIYRAVLKEKPDLNLILAGNGPYMEEFRDSLKDCERVAFVGKLEQHRLAQVYAAADLLVFPSVTDTFGMAVLEAQSCGLPALVSDRGGPQEIVQDGQTGFILPSGRTRLWVEKILELIELARNRPASFYEFRRAARQMALQEYNWDHALLATVGRRGMDAEGIRVTGTRELSFASGFLEKRVAS